MKHSTRFVVGTIVLGLFASAAPAQAATLAGCPGTSVSVLFWPKGHNARPGAGFPKFKTPHVEVYSGKHTTKFPSKASTAYLDAKGTASVAGQCSIGIAKFSGKAFDGTTRTSAGNIICSGTASYVLGKIKGGARLQIFTGKGDIALDLKIKGTGSTAKFSSACKAQAPPG